jgi:hypothetical protein
MATSGKKAVPAVVEIPAAVPVAAPFFGALSDAARTVDPTAAAQLPTEAPQVFLKRLVQAISQAADPVWESLGEAPQTWYNAAAESIEGGVPIAEPAGFVAVVPVARHAAVAPAARTRPTSAPKAAEAAEATDAARDTVLDAVDAACDAAEAAETAEPTETLPVLKASRSPGIVAIAQKLIITHSDPLTLNKKTARALMVANKVDIKDTSLSVVLTYTLSAIRMAIEAGRFI